ncbi:Uncharacterised protein [Chlamydia trachomatis]|nr:Uncharacterised protein [Chlamydia trachomatis]
MEKYLEDLSIYQLTGELMILTTQVSQMPLPKRYLDFMTFQTKISTALLTIQTRFQAELVEPMVDLKHMPSLKST